MNVQKELWFPVKLPFLLHLQKRMHLLIQLLYKEHFALKFKVQSSHFRGSHIDAHYCSVQFCYMREYAINLRDITTFPAISSGVWCKKYHTNKHWSWSSWPSCKLQGLSHTFLLLKGWYTWRASRRLFIPEDYFYCGQVVVLLKDSVLEPCSPFRHGVKIKSIFEDSCRPVLIIFSDGGPGQRVTFHSAQPSLISIFKEKKYWRANCH